VSEIMWLLSATGVITVAVAGGVLLIVVVVSAIVYLGARSGRPLSATGINFLPMKTMMLMLLYRLRHYEFGQICQLKSSQCISYLLESCIFLWFTASTVLSQISIWISCLLQNSCKLMNLTNACVRKNK